MMKRTRRAHEMSPLDLARKLRDQFGPRAEKVASHRADAANTYATAAAYERALDILRSRKA